MPLRAWEVDSFQSGAKGRDSSPWRRRSFGDAGWRNDIRAAWWADGGPLPQTRGRLLELSATHRLRTAGVSSRGE